MIERKGIKKEIVGTLRAPDILWKHYGPKIRRSRDSIFVVWIESRESAAESSLILFFLNVTEDEEIKLPPAMLLLNIWGTFECCVDSYLMFEYLPYVHVYSLLPFKLRALNDLSSGCVFLDHFFFLEIKFVCSLSLQKSLVSSNKILQEKKIVLAFYCKWHV